LTDAGQAIAEKIYERHNTLSQFFMSIGVDEKTALEDACKVEHYISDITFDRIKAFAAKHTAG
jgi:Mn-dependent DtxR family transcriptional regulator